MIKIIKKFCRSYSTRSSHSVLLPNINQLQSFISTQGRRQDSTEGSHQQVILNLCVGDKDRHTHTQTHINKHTVLVASLLFSLRQAGCFLISHQTCSVEPNNTHTPTHLVYNHVLQTRTLPPFNPNHIRMHQHTCMRKPLSIHSIFVLTVYE